MIKIKAYAKINLALEVMDLENGYHKVNNLMIPIDLYDEIEIVKDKDIYVKDDPFPNDNIMVRAAKLFFSYTHIDGGCKIKIKKNIPSAAGLAGGSSDAASTLKGLNMLYDTKLSNEVLIELSKELGSDVGFFIESKIAMCVGRGEIVIPIDLNVKPIPLVLIKPNVELSTALVYKHYVYLNESKKAKIDNILASLKENDVNLLKENIFNDLEKTSLELSKELKDLYEKIKIFGVKPYVSGSGPTMFLLNEDKEVINQIKKNIKDAFIYEGYTK